MISRLVRKHGERKLVCLALDVMSFALGIYCSLVVSEVAGTFSQFVERSVIFVIAAILTIFSFRYNNLYKQRVIYSNLRQLILLTSSSLFTFLSVLVLYFLFKPEDIQHHYRIQVSSFIAISYILVVLNRFLVFRNIFRGYVPSSNSTKNVLAIGAGNVGVLTARKLMKHRALGYDLVGFVDDNKKLLRRTIEGVKVLGTTDDLEELVASKNVDELFITINDIKHENLFELIEKCKNVRCPVNIVSDHFSIVEKKLQQSEFEEFRFVSLFPTGGDLYQSAFKRVIDVVLAIVILAVMSPAFALIAILIKLGSKGPVFYVPTSIGKNGKPFRFYKFRSMRHNVSHDRHRQLVEDFISGKKKDGSKLQDDPRITAIGRIIRKYSLDEFAQLINVLKGDMSLVGPRPSTQYEYQMMEHWHKKRYSVLPGMTGLWQVSGRSEVSFTEMIMMDVYYAENCSFWLDIVILLKTIRVVLLGKGGR